LAVFSEFFGKSCVRCYKQYQFPDFDAYVTGIAPLVHHIKWHPGMQPGATDEEYNNFNFKKYGESSGIKVIQCLSLV
jgi:hypothetical protein